MEKRQSIIMLNILAVVLLGVLAFSACTGNGDVMQTVAPTLELQTGNSSGDITESSPSKTSAVSTAAPKATLSTQEPPETAAQESTGGLNLATEAPDVDWGPLM